MRALLRGIVTSDPELEVAGEATNGLEALQQVKQIAPDLILLDIEMPHMDGVALTRTIWKLNPSLDVIISSGIGQDSGWLEKLGELAAAGRYAMLMKPYSVEKLLETLREVTGKP